MEFFDRPQPLTFGVEFEFVVATLDPGVDDPHPEEHTRVAHFPALDVPNYIQIYAEREEINKEDEFATYGPLAERIAAMFRWHNIPAYPWFQHAGSRYPATDRDLAGWEVKLEDSIGVDGRDREETRYSHDAYTYLGIEVVSPVMRMYMDTYPGDPVKDERDCEEVGEVARLLETRLRSFCSRSCGLHIRVGDEARGFNLDAMRKFIHMGPRTRDRKAPSHQKAGFLL